MLWIKLFSVGPLLSAALLLSRASGSKLVAPAQLLGWRSMSQSPPHHLFDAETAVDWGTCRFHQAGSETLPFIAVLLDNGISAVVAQDVAVVVHQQVRERDSRCRAEEMNLIAVVSLAKRVNGDASYTFQCTSCGRALGRYVLCLVATFRCCWHAVRPDVS